VTFGYSSSKTILTHWTDTFESGEVVALTGPSGRGKSTALYLLGLMLKPVDGFISIDGLHASSLRDAQRAHLRAFNFGFVFQDAALDPTRSILDNVVESSLYRGQSRTEALAQASALLNHFGVQVAPNRRPGEVSGGQAQRIALCRAILSRPSVILADEPTGNLDKSTSTLVIDALRAEAERGAVVVVATHDEDVMRSCDRRLDL
jgi:ABC-type lipoprotein export system ATPase subunit